MTTDNDPNTQAQPGRQGAFPVDRPVEALLRDHDMVLHHIGQEEGEFFPKLERAQLDMTAIGLQMASFEASLVHTMTIQGSRSGARR